MSYKLFWMPLEKADPTPIPFMVVPETGRLVYTLPAGLTFGCLEINGVNISGYFQPTDETTEYGIRRPQNFGKTPEVVEEEGEE